MGALTIHTPGLLTTVQDLGRAGYARLGVSACGAADALSLRIANRLVGNRDHTPALEMTILGGTFEVDATARVAIAGADMSAVVEDPRDGSKVPAPLHTSFTLMAGQRLRFAAARSGARTYLAMRGGFDVPLVLGSASTHVPSRLGGHEGRPLRQGDRIGFAAAEAPAPLRSIEGATAAHPNETTLRVTEGVQARQFASTSRETFAGAVYAVSPQSDRMGLRLAGPTLSPPLGGQMPSEGMPLGAIQVPPGGEPILLFVDHQTTGGYPVIASVVSADLHRVGQLRPGDRVRFEVVSLQTARELLVEQEAWLQAALPPPP